MMKKMTIIFFLLFCVISSVVLNRILRFDLFPKARAQANSNLPPPTDMPLPPDAGAPQPSAAPQAPPAAKSGSTVPAIPPPPPVQQQGLPVDNGKDASATAPQVPTTQSSATPDLESIKFLSSQDFVYDPKGRRDPFRSYLYVQKKSQGGADAGGLARVGIPTLLQNPAAELANTAESYDLSEMSVAAILWDIGDPKALLEAPSKKLFLVHRHTRVGKNGGYVAAIREGEVVVVEFAPDGRTPSTRVMVLQR